MKPLLETAVVGGGCFWCIEAIMDSIKGVVSVTPGYAGGTTEAPTYRQVCTGATGHVEVVRIEFDSAVISYADLLRIFMVMHNPARVNVQGGDKGRQYRSVILYNSKQQERMARAVIGDLKSHFDAPVLTDVLPLEKFHEAEARHQHYYRSNPAKAYCETVISPKLARLRNQFSDYLKPVILP